MKITSSRLLPFLEPITVELSVKQTERLAQLLEAYLDARQLRVSALAQGAQSLSHFSQSHFSQGGYEACYKAVQRFLGRVEGEALRQALRRLLPGSTLADQADHPATLAQPLMLAPYVLRAAGHYRSRAPRGGAHLLCGHPQRW